MNIKRKIEILNNELALSLDNNIKDMNDLTWNILRELDMFTYDELMLVTSLNGDNIDTLNNVLYIRYGYRNIEQYLESEYEINIYDHEDH